MSVVVFGGAGFIGTHLLTELRSKKIDAVSVDIAKPERPVAGVRYEYGDVRKPIELEGDFGAVFNLAAVHRTPGHPGEEYFETNVAGALNVTEFARSQGINNLVFTSSISVYGPNEVEKNEHTEPTPTSNYGKSKLLAEQIHRNWLNESDARHLVVVRPAVTFGLGEGGNFDRLLRALTQRRFVYPGRTDTIKSCGHVTDLVGSMLWALDLGEREITYNYCYPQRTTIEKIATTVAATFDVAPPPFTLPMKLMLAASTPFEMVEKTGLKSGINRARIMKLVESTNIYPKVLVERGYKYRTDIDSGIKLWAESEKSGRPEYIDLTEGSRAAAKA